MRRSETPSGMHTRDRMPDRFLHPPPATMAGFVGTLPFEVLTRAF